MFNRIKPALSWIIRHKYISVSIVFFLIILVFDDNNLIKHYKNKSIIAELEDEIAAMKRDSAESVKRQNQLDYRGDVKMIEDLAREKYGMHKANEEVFIIE